MARYRVFVYGTLKTGGYYWRRLDVGRYARATPARVRGQLWHLPVGYPAITTGSGWVHGELLSFHAAALMAAIDTLEDFVATRPATANLYQRPRVRVVGVGGGDLGWAWVYRMDAATVAHMGGIRVPVGVWRDDGRGPKRDETPRSSTVACG